jgi:hypothetical protein
MRFHTPAPVVDTALFARDGGRANGISSRNARRPRGRFELGQRYRRGGSETKHYPSRMRRLSGKRGWRLPSQGGPLPGEKKNKLDRALKGASGKSPVRLARGRRAEVAGRDRGDLSLSRFGFSESFLPNDLEMRPHQINPLKSLRDDEERRDVFYVSRRGMNRILSVQLAPGQCPVFGHRQWPQGMAQSLLPTFRVGGQDRPAGQSVWQPDARQQYRSARARQRVRAWHRPGRESEGRVMESANCEGAKSHNRQVGLTRMIGAGRARSAWSRSRSRRPGSVTMVLFLAVLLGALGPGARSAWAFPFEDIAAFLQRNAHYILQFRQLLSAARDTRESIMKAYEGIKDWKNLGWVDTLDLVHAPWFDQVDGIEDLRAVTDLTVLNVEQATKLFDDLRDFGSLEHNPRYRRDGWYRTRVDSIRGIARRARAHRVALLRQMQSHNRALSKDTERVRRLRDRIEEESKKEPANQGTISSLQGELAAIQAKHEGENMMMVNQNAIMNLVGAENMDESFLEAVDGDWMGDNRRGFREFGRSFSK